MGSVSATIYTRVDRRECIQICRKVMGPEARDLLAVSFGDGSKLFIINSILDKQATYGYTNLTTLEVIASFEVGTAQVSLILWRAS